MANITCQEIQVFEFKIFPKNHIYLAADGLENITFVLKASRTARTKEKEQINLSSSDLASLKTGICMAES